MHTSPSPPPRPSGQARSRRGSSAVKWLFGLMLSACFPAVHAAIPHLELDIKLDPRTKDIPIVVVSAKDITTEERKRLNGHIEALYQKGSLPPRKFVDQVIHTIEDKNGA